MARPSKDLIDLQNMWVEAWSRSLMGSLQCWMHLFELQRNFFQQAEKHQRSRVEIASGPSFMDKYGKRSHDINPERDV